jgi:hypothetical protein
VSQIIGRPVRADARRNRDRLLDAAVRAFATDGATSSYQGRCRNRMYLPESRVAGFTLDPLPPDVDLDRVSTRPPACRRPLRSALQARPGGPRS